MEDVKSAVVGAEVVAVWGVVDWVDTPVLVVEEDYSRGWSVDGDHGLVVGVDFGD